MKVGQQVQYIAKTTRGARAATITAIENVEEGRVTLFVMMPNAHVFPAYDVTPEPSTKIEHYWRYIPEDEEDDAVEEDSDE